MTGRSKSAVLPAALDKLEERYGMEVPVLLVDGERVAGVRITEDALARILTKRAPSSNF